MHLLVAPFGTEGDVRPLLAFAHAMAARGHRVSLLANPHFAPLVPPQFALIPIGSEASFDENADRERIWRPVAGAFLFLGLVQRGLRETFAALEGARFDLVAGNTVSIAAMTWAEQARIPRLLLHIQPMPVRSQSDVPLVARGLEWTTRLPPRAASAWFHAVDAATRPLLVPLNVFRRRHGLRTIHSFDALWRNAEGLAALYPRWLAPPQPDWPAGLQQFGALRPAQGAAPLPDAVERFLAQGATPVVWTQGSYHVDLARLARIAREATAATGMRSIVLGVDEQGGGDVLAARYASLASLLPRSRALVHHGGIGTGLEAIAAGIPQLIVPRAADHHDNARRFVRTGAAMSLDARRFDAKTAARALRALLDSPTVAAAVRKHQAMLAADDPAPALCAYAERLAARAP